MLIKFGFTVVPHYYPIILITRDSHRKLFLDVFEKQNRAYVIDTLMQKTSVKGV